MDLSTFSELWDQHVTQPLANRVEDPNRPLLPGNGPSPRLQEALLAAARGDLSHFDRARVELREAKLAYAVAQGVGS